VIRLRSRNGRLVNRSGLLVPSCNECPPCVPPDPCPPGNLIQYNINDAGNVAIDFQPVAWPGSTVSDSNLAERFFRVNFIALPVVRGSLRLNVTEYDVSVSASNTLNGVTRLLIGTALSSPQLVLELPLPTINTFARRRAIRSGATITRELYNPLLFEFEIEILSATETSPGEGSATIEVKTYLWDAGSGGNPNEFLLQSPTVTSIGISYTCDTRFHFQAAITAAGSRALSPYDNILPVIIGDVDWSVETVYP
jgi:hypothetical protein